MLFQGCFGVLIGRQKETAHACGCPCSYTSEMVDPPPPDCWLHPCVAVGQSAIQGRGLFAGTDFLTGTVVSRLGGRLVHTSELDVLVRASEHGGPYVDSIVVDDDVHLVLPAGTSNGLGNHSCDPNLWWIDAYTLVTRRQVEMGEELTNDYATSTASDTFSMQCSCGSALCRGVIAGDDWRLPELQDRYQAHWVPVLNRRIRP